MRKTDVLVVRYGKFASLERANAIHLFVWHLNPVYEGRGRVLDAAF